METWMADLRYALRKLAHAPGFTAVALLTLALGIGANSAIFSVVYGVLFRPMGFHEPDELVQLYSELRGNRFSAFSAPNFLDVQGDARSFSGVAAMGRQEVTLTGAGDPVGLDAGTVSAGLFEVLGVSPVLGRSFRPEENEPGGSDVVILSHALWQDRFGGDAEIVGKTIQLQRRPHQVIGVMPRGFDYPEERQLWTPLVYGPGFRDVNNRGAFGLGVIARLAPGATIAQADAELRPMAQRLAAEVPEIPLAQDNFSMSATGLREAMIGDVQQPLAVLLGAVGFVLLIACANVANLLLARASMRETEMAVRTALGAGRGRLTRQLLTESVVLGVLGGCIGLLLALWGSAALVRLQPDVPRLAEVRVDGAVVLFTFAIALFASLVFGAAPALQAARQDPFDALREGGRGPMASRRTHRMRSALVVAELALAVLLLTGAGLLIRSFAHLLDQDPGFRPENVLTFRVQLPSDAYPDDERRQVFFASLLDQLRALPGMRDAAAVSYTPLVNTVFRIGFEIDGGPERVPGTEQVLDVRVVTPDYFRTLAIPVARGRAIEATDRDGTLPVALLNEAAVRRYFPNEDPIGRTIRLGWGRGPGQEDTPGTVVGIAGDVRLRNLREDAPPTIYLAHAQVAVSGMSVVARAQGEPAALTAAIRETLLALDPNLPLDRVTTMDGVIAESVAQPRFYMLLLVLFAAVALALAAIGIFGVMSFIVAQRKREIGIRMALGAREASVLRLVLGRSLGLIAAGIGIGLIAALGLTNLLRSLLFGVTPLDPLVLAATATLLALTALAASWLPARRAARLDPLVALRTE